MPVSRRWTVPSYVATLLTWFGVATTSFVVLTVLLDWSPAPSMIAAQGLLPLIVVGALGVVAVSVIRRDWIPALAALAPTIAGSVLVVSVTTPAAEPAWAASSARLTVFASNVLKSNRDPDAGLRAAVESDADVVVLSEMTVRFEAALQRSGLLQRYPTLVRETDNVLLTRLPVADQGIRRHGGVDLPSATVIVGGRKVLVLAVQQGLLGAPDLQIAGNGSSGHLLRWYQDRSPPAWQPGEFWSAPLWVYRLLMLGWALWLAWALLGWLRWGWQCWGRDGHWRRRAPRRTAAATVWTDGDASE